MRRRRKKGERGLLAAPEKYKRKKTLGVVITSLTAHRLSSEDGHEYMVSSERNRKDLVEIEGTK